MMCDKMDMLRTFGFWTPARSSSNFGIHGRGLHSTGSSRTILSFLDDFLELIVSIVIHK